VSRIVVSKELYRPVDIMDIYGNPEKVKKELGWQYDMTIENIVDVLLEEEIENFNVKARH